ncbi:MAG: ABC transporter permease [Ferrovibrio sp.]|uniref:ABC transporter permease n=1 Tax=Ferrovibrio sp. TaxID=1917215 RepID=UPI003918EF61
MRGSAVRAVRDGVAETATPPAAAIIPSIPAPDTYPEKLLRLLRYYRPQLRAVAIGLVAIAAAILAWHLLTHYRVNIYIRFINVPSPEQVLDRAILAFSGPQYIEHMLISMRRILIGFAVATVIAVPLGLLMGRFLILKEIIFPVTEVVRPIPAIAWVPMSIMLWPNNEESIVFITFLGSFFPILINTLHGMVTVDPVLVRAAKCLGANEVAIFREVYFPSSLPQIFTGLTVGMGVAWVSLIAAEMISGQFGIGYFTWEAYSLVQYSDIALGMISIGALGLLSSGAIRLVGRMVMPWLAGR